MLRYKFREAADLQGGGGNRSPRGGKCPPKCGPAVGVCHCMWRCVIVEMCLWEMCFWEVCHRGGVLLLLNYLSTSDRQAVGEHLPLASTASTEEEEQRLMVNLENLRKKFNSTEQ